MLSSSTSNQVFCKACKKTTKIYKKTEIVFNNLFILEKILHLKSNSKVINFPSFSKFTYFSTFIAPPKVNFNSRLNFFQAFYPIKKKILMYECYYGLLKRYCFNKFRKNFENSKKIEISRLKISYFKKNPVHKSIIGLSSVMNSQDKVKYAKFAEMIYLKLIEKKLYITNFF